ncbi:UDP-N-acetylglucosamine--N-acetylmuramyl-(pentapeptide) pyrophosphoryl-undecaprenol N-acetylglucosamine transferase [Streptomyces luteolus]|uniref:UDP-N-acetylglucosamine--N-acetylmuramyl-(pentapeptide) pyrophosphoryl-undecaprenol N-acetylglucosamine transferase n=1 Tax=Streptomyces luteolus TaxID=3043615 RepID=A0ABT6T1A0_9ACTN|nr:UDP-N-acetylglucosamine--N-acetylmuramyl-(pentapeptide) pyrophosphoryl-undecaprenol N-acetylglucosamine transferase [Streptomyces sp. B-S-A12]MDI3421619.1 UDP-N-acetylglucosamine--N-acetylmuramyl-(pentapeptide) pyrophosphoryl-undecaprenol N-acetylglucosamine transferase [Streptomyces sp. B-S-A12]
MTTPRTTQSPLSVVIGAGGTGGHIYPGLALADALRRVEPDATISFVGTERGLETRLIPEAGYRLHTVDMIPFDPALGAKRFLLPAALVKSGAQCRSILRAQAAHVAVGMGGYPSAPAVVGARMAGLPSVIHESNAVPGRANRFAALLTDQITLAFEESRAHLTGSRHADVVGMPVAAELAALRRPELRTTARRAFGIPDDVRMLLVNGGSLGAARLTAAATGLARRWRDRSDVHLLIKTGPAALDQTRRLLAESGADRVATAVPYLDRMDLAYAAADLAVCRAGSATVAELSVTRTPAVLVPYPYAPGDHQTHNARVLTDVGAGLLLPDADTDPDRLAALVEPLLAEPSRLHAMAAAAPEGPHARAADLLAAHVLRLAGRPAPYASAPHAAVPHAATPLTTTERTPTP